MSNENLSTHLEKGPPVLLFYNGRGKLFNFFKRNPNLVGYNWKALMTLRKEIYDITGQNGGQKEVIISGSVQIN